MTKARRLGAYVPVFAALGDEMRLSLVTKLARGAALSITELTRGTDVTRQAVSKHLRVLEGAGLVRAERRGRESRYALATAPLEEAREALSRISQQWDDALERLRAFVEK